MTRLKDIVAQAVPNDATTDTLNDTTQEFSTVVATMTVVRINAEETHDESDKANVAQAVLNDATTNTANDTTQEVGAVLATVIVETS